MTRVPVKTTPPPLSTMPQTLSIITPYFQPPKMLSGLDSHLSLNNWHNREDRKESAVSPFEEQSTPGCCFPYLPLHASCYPLNPLNPRGQRHKSQFLPFSSQSSYNSVSHLPPLPGQGPTCQLSDSSPLHLLRLLLGGAPPS